MATLNPSAPVKEILKTTGYECPPAAANLTLAETIAKATDAWTQKVTTIDTKDNVVNFLNSVCTKEGDKYYLPSKLPGILHVTIDGTVEVNNLIWIQLEGDTFTFCDAIDPELTYSFDLPATAGDYKLYYYSQN